MERYAADEKSRLNSKLGLMGLSSDCRDRVLSNEVLLRSKDDLFRSSDCRGLSVEIRGKGALCGSGDVLFLPSTGRVNSFGGLVKSNDGIVLSVPSLPV